MVAGGDPGSRVTLLRRFTLLTLGTTIVVGVLFGVLLARMVESFAFHQQARALADRVLEVTASSVSVQSFQVGPGRADPRFRRMLQILVGQRDILQIVVWNDRGETLYRLGESPADAGPTPPMISAGDRRLRWRLLASPRSPDVPGPLLEVDVPVIAAGITQPIGFYRVVADVSSLAAALARVIWSIRLSVVLGVLMLYAVLFTIVRRASADLDRSESVLRGAFAGIIRSLVNALDARDMATAHHSSRVAENAVAIARAMALGEEAIQEVRAAAFLHDIGKIGIPDGLLTKQAPLTDEERRIMQQHTVYGHAILDPVAISPGIKLAVRHSHERWDGTGYPDGLAGGAIPMAARVIAVADAYEALTTDRPYRRARSHGEAVREVARGAGSQFDPGVVDAALRTWETREGGPPSGRSSQIS